MAATSTAATTAAIHIAGAGIAGTAVALALHDADADVVLHEAHPHGVATRERSSPARAASARM